MSTSLLRLIPDSKIFIPDRTSQQEALKFLEENYACDIECEEYDKVEFIDQGENLETIICPNCKAENVMDFFAENDPFVEWWYEISEENQFPGNPIKMPCCGETIEPTNLSFKWPAGFARFELCLNEPDQKNLQDGKLPQDHQSKLETILKCKLIQIRTQY